MSADINEGQRVIEELIRASLIIGTLKADEVANDPETVQAVAVAMGTYLDAIVDRLQAVLDSKAASRE